MLTITDIGDLTKLAGQGLVVGSLLLIAVTLLVVAARIARVLYGLPTRHHHHRRHRQPVSRARLEIRRPRGMPEEPVRFARITVEEGRHGEEDTGEVPAPR